MFGLDAAGTVVSVGRSVKDFKEGDRVYVNPGLSCGSCKQCLAGLPTRCASYTFMGYFGFSPSSKEVFREYRHAGDAQYLRAPARNLITLADDLPFEVAMRLGYLGTAYSALKKLELTPGKSLLILGASGTLGIGATLAAVAMGVTDVIVAARDGAVLERLRQLAAKRIRTLAPCRSRIPICTQAFVKCLRLELMPLLIRLARGLLRTYSDRSTPVHVHPASVHRLPMVHHGCSSGVDGVDQSRFARHQSVGTSPLHIGPAQPSP